MRKKGPTLVRIALAIMLILVLLPLTAAPAAALPAADKVTIGTLSGTTVTPQDFYRFGATATVILEIATDPDTVRANTAKARITSATDTVGIDITLTETGVNTGILTGTVIFYGATTPATAPPSGQVLVNSGNTVTATVAINAAGTGAPAAQQTDTATIDNTGPTIAMTTPGAWTTVSNVDYAYIKADAAGNFYDIAGTATDAGSGVARVDVSVDGGTTWFTAIGLASWSYRWQPLPADGSYGFQVRALDSAGNIATLPASGANPRTIKVDNTKPSVTEVASDPDKAHKGLNVKITAKVSDDTSGINTVTADISKLFVGGVAGSAVQTMYDDATHGDKKASDGIYTISDINNDGAVDTTNDIVVSTTVGTYEIKVKATDKSANSTTVTASVEVVNDTAEPTIDSKKSSATGAISGVSEARVGDVVELVVEAADDLSGVKKVTVDGTNIKATKEDGTAWADITKIPLAKGSAYKVKVKIGADTTTGAKTLKATVTDNANLTKTADLKVTVAATINSYKLNLAVGWNLVSLPSAPLDTNMAAMLGIAAGRVTTYSSTEGRWYDSICRVSRGACSWAGSLDTIVAGQGYFMEAKKAASVVINLEPVEVLSTPPSYTLPAGWSLIGYTNLGLSQAQTLALTYVRGLSVIALYRLDTASGVPMRLIVDTVVNGGEYVVLGGGYWIYLDRAGRLVP